MTAKKTKPAPASAYGLVHNLGEAAAKPGTPFCAQRGCEVPPDHTDPMCPVCNNPLQTRVEQQTKQPTEGEQQ